MLTGIVDTGVPKQELLCLGRKYILEK